MPTLRFNIGGQEITRDVSAETANDPAQIAQLVEEAQGQARGTAEQQAQAEASTTTTPTSETPGALPAHALSAAFAAQVPTQAGKAVVRAVGERTVDPAARLALGQSGGALRAAGDVAQVVGSAAMPGVAALGAGVQALTDVVTDDANFARKLASITEFAGSAGQVLLKGASASRQGAKLVRGAGKLMETQPGAADLLPTERLSMNLVRGIRSTIGRSRKGLQQGLDAIDNEARGLPSIDRNSPGGVKFQEALAYIQDSELKLDSRSQALLGPLDPDQPVPARVLVQLRKTLRDQMKFKNAADPDASANARKAAALRSKITDALESAMPDEMLGRFREARTAYRSNVVEPMRALRTVLSENTTPAQAFKAVFQAGDPNTFRTIVRLSRDSSAVKGQLRIGYLDTIREATGNFQNAKATEEAFRASRPMLAATGLFSPEELSSLDVLLRRRALPNAIEALKSTFTTGGIMRTGVGLSIAYSLKGGDISTLATAAIAAGALPQLRRLAILPVGSSEGRKLAMQTVNQLVKFSRDLNSDKMVNPDTIDVVDDEDG